MKNWRTQYAHLIETYQAHVLVIDTEGVLLRPQLRHFLETKGYTLLLCNSVKGLNAIAPLFVNTDKHYLIESRTEYAPPTLLSDWIGVKKILYKKLFPNLNTDFLIQASDTDLDTLSLTSVKVFEAQTYAQTARLLIQTREQLAKHTVQTEQKRLLTLEKWLNEYCINDTQDPSVWQRLIPQIAEAKLLRRELNVGMSEQDWSELENRFNTLFQDFIQQNFRQLHSRSWRKQPFTVSRILDFIKDQCLNKVALVVIDGMSFLQWRLLAQRLDRQNINYTEGSSFAFVPSITAWSRQAIFRGGVPDLTNTKSEESFFKTYWANHNEPNVGFQKRSFLKSETRIGNNQPVIGVITNDLDELMHAEKMGGDHLLDNTEKWLDNPHSSIIHELHQLKAEGYTVFLTADHGNIEATGIGSINLSSRNITTSRSKRHILFSEQGLLDRFLQSLDKIQPERSELSVFLAHKEAFCPINETVVTHGGSHFWEVFIPFIKI